VNDNEPELDDLILAAFKRAFADGRMDVAEHLLIALETVSGRPAGDEEAEIGLRVGAAYGMITKLGERPER
jgi:hypothetical protein